MIQYNEEIDYKLVNQKEVYHGKRVIVKELNYWNDRDQKEVYREHVLAGDAVAILAMNDQKEVFLVREPRTPIGITTVGLPAGMVEKGEDYVDAAVRELEEEIGYRANNVKYLRSYYPSCGYADEKVELYLATNLVKTKQKLDETEDIEVIKVPLEEVKKMLDKEELLTASTIIAVMHYIIYEENKGE